MQNATGEIVDLYIPRKCSWTNRILAANDFGSVQINVADIDPVTGVSTKSYSTYALSGFVRQHGEGDEALAALVAKHDAHPHVYQHISLTPASRSYVNDIMANDFLFGSNWNSDIHSDVEDVVVKCGIIRVDTAPVPSCGAVGMRGTGWPILIFLLQFNTIKCETFTNMYQKSIQRLSTLISSSYADPIASIVDCGANTGDWTKMIQKYFPQSSIFMIEGNPKLESMLSQVGVPYVISLVGDRRNQTVQFHTHRKYHTGGSVYREQLYSTMKSSDIVIESYQSRRIDDLLAAQNITKVDFLKLDIQGSEFNALRGAIETLKSVTYVTLEISVHQYNPGAVQFSDINIFLEKRGFRLYDVIDLRYGMLYPPNIQGLIQIDYLWAKASSKIFQSTVYPEPPRAVYGCHALGSSRGGGGGGGGNS